MLQDPAPVSKDTPQRQHARNCQQDTSSSGTILDTILYTLAINYFLFFIFSIYMLSTEGLIEVIRDGPQYSK